MAFGLLGSIIPQINRNEILYTSSASNLALGKVSISSKNYNPVKVRLGITEDDINIEYLVYNKFINYGETFETEQIHLGDGQKLVVRSSDPNVNFLFYGETINETLNPVKSGMLSSVLSTNSQKKLLYTAPSNSNIVVTLSVCNLDSQPAKARIGISDGNLNAFDGSEYLEYDVEIGPNQTYTRTEIKLDQNQSLICSSSNDSNINFLCHGRLFYEEASEENLIVRGNARIDGSVGIGTTQPRAKLDVIGDVFVTGFIDGVITPSKLEKSLINLSSLPQIDGSKLTGIIATGAGFFIENNGEPAGIVSVMNFGSNIDASSAISGRSTIKLSNSVNVIEDFSVAINKFNVRGINGNTNISGTLGVGSSLTVSGNINALNNKVINVGSATSTTDATNKRYVDTRSIAMSIALS